MTDATPTDHEVETMKAEVQALLTALNVEADCHVETGSNYMRFDVRGDGEELFHHRGGEVLRDVSFVLHRLHQTLFPDSETEVKFDAASIQSQYEEELSKIGLDAAERVRDRGRRVSIGPFNPYDRRLIHLALGEESDIETESIGRGHMKKIIVRLIDEGDNGEEE